MKTTADLRAELSDIETREVLLQNERSQIAYEAISIGDAKARKRLDEINSDLVIIGQEVASMKAAIHASELRDDVDAANARDEQARLNAARAAELGKTVLECCADVDAHAAELFEKIDELRDIMIELNRLGAAPNLNLVDVGMKRALITHSMGSRLQFEHLAPGERHSFIELGERWSTGI